MVLRAVYEIKTGEGNVLAKLKSGTFKGGSFNGRRRLLAPSARRFLSAKNTTGPW